MDARTLPTHPDLVQDARRPPIRTVEAVVNPASGGVDAAAAEALRVVFDELGLQSRVTVAEGGGVDAAIRAAVAARPDLLVVLAGDGTARLAAAVAGPEGPLIAPLPGGTMNMLAHALYGNVGWREALVSALTHGVERSVSGGEIGGRPFYCVAILGSPALWAPAREAARAGKLARAWRHAVLAFRRAFLTRLHFELDGGAHHRGIGLSLICPLVSKALHGEGALEAAVLDFHDVSEAFRFGLTNLLGDWRSDPGVTVRHCRRGWVWARGPIPCLFDGELHRLERSAVIRFRPNAFRALAPAPAGEVGATSAHP
jgi:diacylglycerol kinase family enzyme